MKIGISSTGTNMANLVDVRFGRCNNFAIHDTKDGSYRFLENKAQNAGGGAGISSAQQMIDEGVEVILTGNMGPNAFRVIAEAGIKIYRVSNIPVEQAVKRFIDNKLEMIEEAGSAHFGM